MRVTIADCREAAARAPFLIGNERDTGRRRFQVPFTLLMEGQTPSGWEKASFSIQLRDNEGQIRIQLHNPGQGIVTFGETVLSASQTHGAIPASTITEGLTLNIQFG